MEREVTVSEYRAFLEARLAAGEPDAEVQKRSPQVPGKVLGSERYYWRVQDGAIVEQRPLAGDLPVHSILWRNMLGYARWRSEVEGREVRLPSQAEWERAARGADGRTHPWGRGFQWDWVVGGQSPLHAGAPPMPRPAGTAVQDRSPFGVLDMAGNVRECCGDELAGRFSVARGASWEHTDSRDFAATEWGVVLRIDIVVMLADIGIRLAAAPKSR